MAFRSSGIVGESDYLDMGNHVRSNPVVGKRRTSWRRQSTTSETIRAEQLTTAAGGNPVDRHKPYVYGASSLRMRDNILKAYYASLEAGES